VKISQLGEIVRYHQRIPSSNPADITNIHGLFFISLFLGVRTEALRAPAIYIARESVPAGQAFHLLLVPPNDLILGIVAQKKSRHWPDWQCPEDPLNRYESLGHGQLSTFMVPHQFCLYCYSRWHSAPTCIKMNMAVLSFNGSRTEAENAKSSASKPSYFIIEGCPQPRHYIAKELNITRNQVYAKYTKQPLAENF